MGKNIIKQLSLAAGIMLPISVVAQQQTNFIVIFMDDMGYGDLGCTGAIGYETPNIEKWRKKECALRGFMLLRR